LLVSGVSEGKKKNPLSLTDL
jgi:hypothetical protein